MQWYDTLFMEIDTFHNPYLIEHGSFVKSLNAIFLVLIPKEGGDGGERKV